MPVALSLPQIGDNNAIFYIVDVDHTQTLQRWGVWVGLDCLERPSRPLPSARKGFHADHRRVHDLLLISAC